MEKERRSRETEKSERKRERYPQRVREVVSVHGPARARAESERARAALAEAQLQRHRVHQGGSITRTGLRQRRRDGAGGAETERAGLRGREAGQTNKSRPKERAGQGQELKGRLGARAKSLRLKKPRPKSKFRKESQASKPKAQVQKSSKPKTTKSKFRKASGACHAVPFNAPGPAKACLLTGDCWPIPTFRQPIEPTRRGSSVPPLLISYEVLPG